MALEIVWTPQAERGYDRIIQYLAEQWSQKEVRNFLIQSQSFFELLSQNPEMLERSSARNNLHRGPMDKHNMITYRIRPGKKQIELLNIRPAKMRPLNK
jgi:plasmid stabilization system protein ParE